MSKYLPYIYSDLKAHNIKRYIIEMYVMIHMCLLPFLSSACNCSIQGTQQIGGVLNKNCNITTGQCACKTEAIGGRKCDVCNPGTKG